MSHKLIQQLSAANVSEEEIMELYQDLQFIYDNPFDAEIEKAITIRKCSYVEVPQELQLLN